MQSSSSEGGIPAARCRRQQWPSLHTPDVHPHEARAQAVVVRETCSNRTWCSLFAWISASHAVVSPIDTIPPTPSLFSTCLFVVISLSEHFDYQRKCTIFGSLLWLKLCIELVPHHVAFSTPNFKRKWCSDVSVLQTPHMNLEIEWKLSKF